MVWLQQVFGVCPIAFGCGWVNSVFIGLVVRCLGDMVLVIRSFQPFNRLLLGWALKGDEIDSGR